MKKRIVLFVIAIVALWDVVTGARLLFSSSPNLAHGSSTLWASAPPLTPAIASLYHRLGAFSLYAGLMTLAFAAVGARHRPTLSVLLVGYMITGVGFFLNDMTYFRGTPYFLVKQAFGVLWTVAVVLHFIDRPKV